MIFLIFGFTYSLLWLLLIKNQKFRFVLDWLLTIFEWYYGTITPEYVNALTTTTTKKTTRTFTRTNSFIKFKPYEKTIIQHLSSLFV
jgi:hypothetical protein